MTRTLSLILLILLAENVNAQVCSTSWPLWYQIQNNRVENVRTCLFEEGQDPNQFQNGIPLITKAIRARQHEIVDLLIEANADVNIKDRRVEEITPLYAATAINDFEMVSRLLDAAADPNIPGRYGITPLILATSLGNVELVKLLLDRGANPDHQYFKDNSENGGALHIASRLGNLPLVKALLSKNADVDVITPRCFTPVFFAAHANYEKVAGELLNYQPIVNIRVNGHGHKRDSIEAAIVDGKNQELSELLVLMGSVATGSTYKNTGCLLSENGDPDNRLADQEQAELTLSTGQSTVVMGATNHKDISFIVANSGDITASNVTVQVKAEIQWSIPDEETDGGDITYREMDFDSLNLQGSVGSDANNGCSHSGGVLECALNLSGDGELEPGEARTIVVSINPEAGGRAILKGEAFAANSANIVAGAQVDLNIEVPEISIQHRYEQQAAHQRTLFVELLNHSQYIAWDGSLSYMQVADNQVRPEIDFGETFCEWAPPVEVCGTFYVNPGESKKLQSMVHLSSLRPDTRVVIGFNFPFGSISQALVFPSSSFPIMDAHFDPSPESGIEDEFVMTGQDIKVQWVIENAGDPMHEATLNINLTNTGESGEKISIGVLDPGGDHAQNYVYQSIDGIESPKTLVQCDVNGSDISCPLEKIGYNEVAILETLLSPNKHSMGDEIVDISWSLLDESIPADIQADLAGESMFRLEKSYVDIYLKAPDVISTIRSGDVATIPYVVGNRGSVTAENIEISAWFHYGAHGFNPDMERLPLETPNGVFTPGTEVKPGHP